MKKTSKILTIVAILLTSISFFVSAQQKKTSIIKGKMGTIEKMVFNLYEIDNGEMKQLASSPTNNGYFGFAFTPEKEGYYVIAQNDRARTYRYIFYLKPGDALSFEIEKDNFKLTGNNNTEENKAIEAWHNFVYPAESKAIYHFYYKDNTFKEFFPMFENMLTRAKALPKTQTGNPKFNASFEDFKKYNLTEIGIAYPRVFKHINPRKNDYSNFHKSINIADLTQKASILNYPNALEFIKEYYIAGIYTNPDISEDKLGDYIINAEKTLIEKSLITNDTVRGEMVINGCKTIKTYLGIKLYEQTYRKYLATYEQKKRLDAIMAKYNKEPQYTEAINFRFEDVNGKQVALSDFKGKVVYVDVWATWCGPCNREIPYMVKLEESYHNNPNIVFMSVSIDSRKDYDKWKNMLKEKGMCGIQLFAGEREAEITKSYAITGIPRFMLFGKDGKAIYTDAPYPSSFEIKAVIDEALKK